MAIKAGVALTFVTPLAKHLGVTMEAIYYRLRHAGYEAPYLDVERGLDLLEQVPKYAKKVRQFRERWKKDPSLGGQLLVRQNSLTPDQARAQDALSSRATPVVTKGKKKAAAKVTATAAETKRRGKIASHWAKKLVRRLMVVLQEQSPGMSFDAAKRRAVKILRDGNYPGPRWDDETRAVEIFKAAGIDMSKFEYLSAPTQGNGDGRALVPASVPPPAQRSRVHVIARPESLPTAVLDERAEAMLAGAGNARIVLEQWKRGLIKDIRDGRMDDFPPRTGHVLEALDALRYPRK